MNDVLETILALLLLELERANEIAELAGGLPVEGPRRLSVTREDLAAGIRDFVDG